MADLEGVAALVGQDVSVETFVDARYDLHLQKIGNINKAFIRKCISNHWKSNAASAVLEQIALTER